MGFFLSLAAATAVHAQSQPEVMEQIQAARAGISEDDRRQREELSRLFVINKKIKEISDRQEQLNRRVLAQEAGVRSTAQDVLTLETRAEQRKTLLNQRLRQLYQERGGEQYRWLFSAKSPIEMDRNRRYLKLMADSDHRQLKVFLANLEVLKKKREQLKGMVARLAILQKAATVQEQELAKQFGEKSKYLADIRKAKETKLSQLKGLRTQHGELNDVLSYAFFERRGALRAPVAAAVTREYGTYVDSQFRFRLTHKGLFYSTKKPAEVHSVYFGRVVFAGSLPGYGHTVIVDHGDNYYSIYAFASQLKVRDGAKVKEGELLALSGESSPLFGPGLYFEIRHFTDAIDPRPWIKDSVINTASRGENL